MYPLFQLARRQRLFRLGSCFLDRSAGHERNRRGAGRVFIRRDLAAGRLQTPHRHCSQRPVVSPAEVGKRRFPPDAAELIATIIERDLPFYDAAISEEAVNGLNRFAQSVGLLAEPVSYEQVVAVQFRDLWRL